MPTSYPRAKVIRDSVSSWGARLTTMEIVGHRFILSEFNTHRAFSRNSASSRAIPFEKQLDRVINDAAIPLVFPREQSGMQGGVALEGQDLIDAQKTWLRARDRAVDNARDLADLGVHKSVTNRLLEPFMWQTIIVSATEWKNFFVQRCSPLAQPEMQSLATAMQIALAASKPMELGEFEWHTPYMDLDDEVECMDRGLDARKVSIARCARVSYLTHDGIRDLAKDIELYERLATATPPHASPLEHVATPISPKNDCLHLGNFEGYRQFRHQVLDIVK